MLANWVVQIKIRRDKQRRKEQIKQQQRDVCFKRANDARSYTPINPLIISSSGNQLEDFNYVIVMNRRFHIFTRHGIDEGHFPHHAIA